MYKTPVNPVALRVKALDIRKSGREVTTLVTITGDLENVFGNVTANSVVVLAAADTDIVPDWILDSVRMLSSFQLVPLSDELNNIALPAFVTCSLCKLFPDSGV